MKGCSNIAAPALLALALSPVVAAQGDAPAPPTRDAAAAEQGTESDPLDLDALLGIEAADAERPDDEADIASPEAGRLERELTAQQVREELVQAVQQMAETADRLEFARDTSLTTQRLQRDVIAKLEVLIEFAEQQQQQGGGSGSSGAGQQRRVQGPQQGQLPEQQQAGQQRDAAASDSQDGMPPAFEEGPGAAFSTDSASWGELPERFRSSLLEGAGDAFSSLYEQMTEAYYRRLAEEATRDE